MRCPGSLGCIYPAKYSCLTPPQHSQGAEAATFSHSAFPEALEEEEGKVLFLPSPAFLWLAKLSDMFISPPQPAQGNLSSHS